jgi:hypothetical protein
VKITNKFYIYFHINPIKNEIFYVGKGSGLRAYRKDNRNIHWNNVVKKYGFIVDIIEDNLEEEKAFEREKFYINKIGIKNLTNMTLGGEGISGYNKDNKGIKNPMYGKHFTNRSKNKMRKTFRKNYKKENHPLYNKIVKKETIEKKSISMKKYYTNNISKRKGVNNSQKQIDKQKKTIRKNKSHKMGKNSNAKEIIYNGEYFSCLKELYYKYFIDIAYSTFIRKKLYSGEEIKK